MDRARHYRRRQGGAAQRHLHHRQRRQPARLQLLHLVRGEIAGVGLALLATTAGSYTLVVRLHAVDSDVPNGHAGTALALATLTLSVGTTAAYQYLDQATLGSVGRYTLSDTTRYALMVSTIGAGAQWVLPAAGNSVTPSGVSFYTVLSGVTSTTGGTMNGRHLAEAVRALLPALPILPRHAGAVAAKPRQVRPIDEDGALSGPHQRVIPTPVACDSRGGFPDAAVM